jgi:hypothetical protein
LGYLLLGCWYLALAAHFLRTWVNQERKKSMAKNYAGRSLALGTSFALVATAVVGVSSPAFANNLTVIPDAGTSTTFISGETFKLRLLGQYASTAALRWEISGIDTANETVTATVTGGQTTAGTTTVTVTPTAVSTTAGANDLSLAVTASQTASVVVRAYIESGDAAGFSATYDTSFSTPVTVNFVKPADVTSSGVTFTTATEADTTVKASFRLAGINNEQLTRTDFAVSFTSGTDAALAGGDFKGGATVAPAITGSEVIIVPAAWDATDGFVATSGTLTALVKDTAVKAQVVYNDGGVLDTDGSHPLAHADNINVGAATTSLVVARRAATITAATVVSTTANSSNESLLDSTFQVKATVKDGATDPAPVAGNVVKATITTNATLSGTAGSVVSLTANGTTYTANNTLPGAGSVATLNLTTNASGEVVVTLATSGYAAAQTVTVSFVTENLAASAVTSTQRAATYTVTRDAFVVTTDGASVSVPVVVYDQFGGRPSNEFDVRAVFDATNPNYAAQATTASTSATSTNVALVGGSATLVLTDNGTGVGVNSYDVTVEKRASGGGYSGALNGVSSAVLDVHIKTAASITAGTVTSNGTQDATTKIYAISGTTALSLVDYATYDPTTVVGAAPSTFTSALTGVEVTGTVSTSASPTAAAVAVPGASVTLTGANLLFSTGNASGKFSVGSITVKANTSGVYSVRIYSNKAGKQTLTITSGAASATTTATFAAAANGTGASLVITAPAAVPGGSTVIATALLTDKYGNPVATTANSNGDGDFSLTYTGPGLAVISSADATDADGGAKLAYFLGSNDTGTITITAKYDKNGDEDYADTGDLTVTKTITIGAGSKVNVGSFNGKLVVYANGYNGKKISWKVGGKWGSAVAASDTARFSRPTPRKGVTVSVQIYVDGVLTLTKSVVTK